MKGKVFDLSFRCYFPKGGFVMHYQKLPLKDIQKWVEAYAFTHPDIQAIIVRIKFGEGEQKCGE